MTFFSFGNNILPTKTLFKERGKYEFISSQEVLSKDINIWFNKIKFGRVDYSNNPVFVSTSRLRGIDSNNDNVLLLLDFVADAFNDFFEFYNSKMSAFNLSPEPTSLYPLNPVRGWENIDAVYKEHIVSIYNKFGNYLERQRLDNKITDFKSFVVYFLRFVTEAISSTPVTKSAFILDEQFPVSPLNSGLAVQLSRQDPSVDLPKLREFIYDNKFNAYRNAAARFGFVVDINVPWRLIADIESKPMQFYMNNNDIIDSRDMFDKCFLRSYLNELEIIKNMFYNFYNTYANSAPSVSKMTKGRNKVIASFITREPISSTEFSKIDDLYWLKIYTFLRAKEMKCGLNQTQFDDLVTKAFDLRKGLDLFSSLGYINKQVKMFSERNTINALEGRFVPNTFRIKG